MVISKYLNNNKLKKTLNLFIPMLLGLKNNKLLKTLYYENVYYKNFYLIFNHISLINVFFKDKKIFYNFSKYFQINLYIYLIKTNLVILNFFFHFFYMLFLTFENFEDIYNNTIIFAGYKQRAKYKRYPKEWIKPDYGLKFYFNQRINSISLYVLNFNIYKNKYFSNYNLFLSNTKLIYKLFYYFRILQYKLQSFVILYKKRFRIEKKIRLAFAEINSKIYKNLNNKLIQFFSFYKLHLKIDKNNKKKKLIVNNLTTNKFFLKKKEFADKPIYNEKIINNLKIQKEIRAIEIFKSKYNNFYFDEFLFELLFEHCYFSEENFDFFYDVLYKFTWMKKYLDKKEFYIGFFYDFLYNFLFENKRFAKCYFINTTYIVKQFLTNFHKTVDKLLIIFFQMDDPLSIFNKISKRNKETIINYIYNQMNFSSIIQKIPFYLIYNFSGFYTHMREIIENYLNIDDLEDFYFEKDLKSFFGKLDKHFELFPMRESKLPKTIYGKKIRAKLIKDYYNNLHRQRSNYLLRAKASKYHIMDEKTIYYNDDDDNYYDYFKWYNSLSGYAWRSKKLKYLNIKKSSIYQISDLLKKSLDKNKKINLLKLLSKRLNKIYTDFYEKKKLYKFLSFFFKQKKINIILKKNLRNKINLKEILTSKNYLTIKKKYSFLKQSKKIYNFENSQKIIIDDINKRLKYYNIQFLSALRIKAYDLAILIFEQIKKIKIYLINFNNLNTLKSEKIFKNYIFKTLKKKKNKRKNYTFFRYYNNKLDRLKKTKYYFNKKKRKGKKVNKITLQKLKLRLKYEKKMLKKFKYNSKFYNPEKYLTSKRAFNKFFPMFKGFLLRFKLRSKKRRFYKFKSKRKNFFYSNKKNKKKHIYRIKKKRLKLMEQKKFYKYIDWDNVVATLQHAFKRREKKRRTNVLHTLYYNVVNKNNIFKNDYFINIFSKELFYYFMTRKKKFKLKYFKKSLIKRYQDSFFENLRRFKNKLNMIDINKINKFKPTRFFSFKKFLRHNRFPKKYAYKYQFKYTTKEKSNIFLKFKKLKKIKKIIEKVEKKRYQSFKKRRRKNSQMIFRVLKPRKQFTNLLDVNNNSTLNIFKFEFNKLQSLNFKLKKLRNSNTFEIQTKLKKLNKNTYLKKKKLITLLRSLKKMIVYLKNNSINNLIIKLLNKYNSLLKFSNYKNLDVNNLVKRGFKKKPFLTQLKYFKLFNLNKVLFARSSFFYSKLFKKSKFGKKFDKFSTTSTFKKLVNYDKHFTRYLYFKVQSRKKKKRKFRLNYFLKIRGYNKFLRKYMKKKKKLKGKKINFSQLKKKKLIISTHKIIKNTYKKKINKAKLTKKISIKQLRNLKIKKYKNLLKLILTQKKKKKLKKNFNYLKRRKKQKLKNLRQELKVTKAYKRFLKKHPLPIKKLTRRQQIRIAERYYKRKFLLEDKIKQQYPYRFNRWLPRREKMFYLKYENKFEVFKKKLNLKNLKKLRKQRFYAKYMFFFKLLLKTRLKLFKNKNTFNIFFLNQIKYLIKNILFKKKSIYYNNVAYSFSRFKFFNEYKLWFLHYNKLKKIPFKLICLYSKFYFNKLLYNFNCNFKANFLTFYNNYLQARTKVKYFNIKQRDKSFKKKKVRKLFQIMLYNISKSYVNYFISARKVIFSLIRNSKIYMYYKLHETPRKNFKNLNSLVPFFLKDLKKKRSFYFAKNIYYSNLFFITQTRKVYGFRMYSNYTEYNLDEFHVLSYYFKFFKSKTFFFNYLINFIFSYIQKVNLNILNYIFILNQYKTKLVIDSNKFYKYLILFYFKKNHYINFDKKFNFIIPTNFSYFSMFFKQLSIELINWYNIINNNNFKVYNFTFLFNSCFVNHNTMALYLFYKYKYLYYYRVYSFYIFYIFYYLYNHLYKVYRKLKLKGFKLSYDLIKYNEYNRYYLGLRTRMLILTIRNRYKRGFTVERIFRNIKFFLRESMKKKELVGYYISIRGRYKRSSRSNKLIIKKGIYSFNNIDLKVDSSYGTLNTKYGIAGIKVIFAFK